MSFARRYFPALALASVALSCTGCVEHSVNGEVETFSYSLLAAMGLFIGGIAAGVAGWMLRDNRFGFILLIGGPVASLVFAPGLFLNKVRMDEEKLYIRTGIWVMPTTVEVKYADIQSVSFFAEERSGRRGRKYTKLVMGINSSQGQSKFDVDGVIEEGLEGIIARLNAKKVTIQDLVNR